MYNMLTTERKEAQGLPSPLVFYSQKKSSGKEECEYCLKKQKLSDGDGNQRCLMHSLQRQQDSPNSDSEGSLITEVVDLLSDVEELLDEYWNNLHAYSNGSPDKVRNDLEPVFSHIRAIEDKLGRFPFHAGPSTPRNTLQRSLLE
jgi:hypothetical protein